MQGKFEIRVRFDNHNQLSKDKLSVNVDDVASIEPIVVKIREYSRTQNVFPLAAVSADCTDGS